MTPKKKEKRAVGRPKEKNSLETKDILRTALKSFAQKGFGGVTIKSLAKETGVADSLLHYHFGNKEELWKKSMEHTGHTIQQELDDIFKLLSDMSGIEKLRLFNKKIVYTSAKYPEFQQVVVQEVFSESSRSDWLIDELLKPIFSYMEAAIKEEMKKGTIKKIPMANISSFIIGSITTFFSRSYQMKKIYGVNSFSKKEVEKHAELINDLLFNGLMK